MTDFNHLFNALVVAVRQAGVIAKAFQGQVENQGKVVEKYTEDESERLQAKKAAKTLIDEVVQEIILLSLQSVLRPDQVVIDAEEQTASLGLFKQISDSELRIVIDPIDGTLEYLEGKDSYSVCVGVVQAEIMKLALVYFPARNTAYAVAPDGRSYVYTNFAEVGVAQPVELKIPQDVPKVAYKNSRVPVEIVMALQASGYSVIDDAEADLGCPDAILKVLNGAARVIFSDTRQVRDILLGAIVGKAKNGFMTDEMGSELVWPNAQRVPWAVFGNTTYYEELKVLFLAAATASSV